MELFYIIVFGALAALAAGLELSKPADSTAIKNADFRRFRNNYLLVYSMMMGTKPRFRSALPLPAVTQADTKSLRQGAALASSVSSKRSSRAIFV